MAFNTKSTTNSPNSKVQPPIKKKVIILMPCSKLLQSTTEKDKFI